MDEIIQIITKQSGPYVRKNFERMFEALNLGGTRLKISKKKLLSVLSSG